MSNMYVRDPHTARLGKEILPFEVGYLPEFFQRKAEFELHDTPDGRTQGIRQLKEMAKRDKHMENIEFDDEFLLQYLIARKFNVARAFSQLKGLINLKRMNPEMFWNFQFDKIVRTMTDKIVTVLPRRCQDGCAIILVELDNWKPEKFPIEEVRRMLVLIILQSLRDPMTQVNGFKAIIDVKSNPIRHLRYCTPHNVHLIYHGTQECAPGRFRGVHLVNQSLTFKTAWIIFKQFLPEKLIQRVHFHSTIEDLQNFFPPSVLPVQYGGVLEDYDMTPWLRKVMSPEQIATMGGGALIL